GGGHGCHGSSLDAGEDQGQPAVRRPAGGMSPVPQGEGNLSALGQALTGSMPSSASRVSTRPRISSRIGRTASIPCPAGSASTQSSYRFPGTYGHASPQPMVTTTSEACTASVVRI